MASTRLGLQPVRRNTAIGSPQRLSSTSQHSSRNTAVSSMAKDVLVYSGEGAGYRSMVTAQEATRACLQENADLQVRTLSTQELLSGTWMRRCALLIMPGGADLPYCKHLDGRGNELIRRFVESGGAYLGICAGSYYACSHVEFEPGSSLQVVGPRELSLCPATAKGAVVPGFDYTCELGAAAVSLQVPALTIQLPAAAASSTSQAQASAQSHCLISSSSSPTPMALGGDEQPQSLVPFDLTLTQLPGMHAILVGQQSYSTGPLPSLNHSSSQEPLESQKQHFKNAIHQASVLAASAWPTELVAGQHASMTATVATITGSALHAHGSSSDVTSSTSSHPGQHHSSQGAASASERSVHLTVRAGGPGHCCSDAIQHVHGYEAAAAGRPSLEGGGGAVQVVLAPFALSDYCNGGPSFELDAHLAISSPSSSHTAQQDTNAPTVLATYSDHGNRVAAVRCRVGRGVAVLCGTHPELPAHALLDLPEERDAVDRAHALSVGRMLAASHGERQKFWQLLLLACCPAVNITAAAVQPEAEGGRFGKPLAPGGCMP